MKRRKIHLEEASEEKEEKELQQKAVSLNIINLY